MKVIWKQQRVSGQGRGGGGRGADARDGLTAPCSMFSTVQLSWKLTNCDTCMMPQVKAVRRM